MFVKHRKRSTSKLHPPQPNDGSPTSLPQLHERKLFSFVLLTLLFGPFIAAATFWLFSGRNYSALDGFSEQVWPITKPFVDMLKQPAVLLTDGSTVDRNQLPISGRLALDNLVIFVDECLLMLQILLILSQAIFCRKLLTERAKGRWGMTLAKRIRAKGYKILAIPAITGWLLWELFIGGFAFRYIEIYHGRLQSVPNFLLHSAIFFTALGIFLFGGLGLGLFWALRK